MRNKLFIVLLAAMLGAALFVSCDSAVEGGQERTVMARFSVPQGKSLSRMNEQFKPEDYYWTYTAAKADGTGLKTGETATEANIPDGAGLAGKEVGPFSMGEWTFRLFAYRDSEHGTKLYEGETSVTFAETSNTVSVQVKPLETGVGTIEIGGNITLADASDGPITPPYRKVVTIKKGDKVLDKDSDGKLVEPSDTKTETEIIDITAESNPPQTYTADAGQYTVTVAFMHTTDDIKYGTSSVVIQVYSNLTTTIGGTLNETTGNTTFTTNCGVTTATNEQTVSPGQATTFTVASTPVQAQVPPDGAQTEVEIPAGGLTGTSAQLSITPYSVESEETGNFTVSGDDAAVYGLDINLIVDGQPVTEFGKDAEGNANKATVTTYVATGLTNPKIVYKPEVGPVETIDPISYGSETGKIVFETTHFSKFFLVAENVVAVNTTTNKAYGDAWTAATQPAWIPTNEAKDGETVVLVKDLEVAPSQWIDVQGKVVLDMNGHKIVKKYDAGDANLVKILILIRGENGDLTIKNGTVEGDAGPYNTFNVYPGATLTIESGTYKCVNGDPQYLIYVKNDATLTVNGGSLIAEGTDASAIGTNGLNDNSVINITGGEIKGANYFPGGGTYTITGGTFENAGTCVYQKSGTLEISGGSFTATGEGNGNYHHRGDGYELTNDAVVVEACGYPNAQPPTIKVTGGTFTGHHAEGAKNNGILLLEWKEANDTEKYFELAADIDDDHKADCRKARLTGSEERGMFTDDETKAFGEDWGN